MSLLSAGELDYREASLLTGLIEAILEDLCVKAEVSLISVDDFWHWKIQGNIEPEDYQILEAYAGQLEIYRGARFLPGGPLAFYLAEKRKIKVVNFYRYCLSIDYVDSKVWNEVLLSAKQKLDAFWGEVEINADWPFSLVAVLNFGETLTVVMWKEKHHQDAEHFIQRNYRSKLTQKNNGLLLDNQVIFKTTGAEKI